MTPAEIVARLHAHWPSIAADKPGSKDWLRLVAVCPNADSAADLLIRTWARDRAPRPADWQEACRAVRESRMWVRPVEETPPREEFEAGLAAARAALHPEPSE